MIRYLLDSTAVWRLLRDRNLWDAWAEETSSGALGSCDAQRVEFRRSARSIDEFEQMTSMFADLHPDVPIPKRAWSWIDAAQFRLVARGQHRALSVVDLVLCATAVHHDLVVLHDDADFRAAARALPELKEHSVFDTPREER